MSGTVPGPVLVLDAGNTHVDVGVFPDGTCAVHHRVAHRGDGAQLAAEVAVAVADWRGWRGAAVASVVPSLDRALAECCRRITGSEPVVIDATADLGIRVVTRAPERVGADRLVNAAAAFLQYGGPVLVVDAGTAVTVCGVTRDGRYLGGAIAPGPGIALEALTGRAEKLPKVLLTDPGTQVGDDTETAMRVGVVVGFAGLVDRLLEEVGGWVGEGATPRVLVTGGLAALLSPRLHTAHERVDGLTLTGLKLLFERARGEAEG